MEEARAATSARSGQEVINASPPILFARIARLDLFERLAPRIIVPTAVFDEVRAGQTKDVTASVALAWAAERRAPDIAVPLGYAATQVPVFNAIVVRQEPQELLTRLDERLVPLPQRTQIVFSQVASRPRPTHRTTPSALSSRSARAIVGRLTAGRARSRSAYRNSLGSLLTTSRIMSRFAPRLAPVAPTRSSNSR